MAKKINTLIVVPLVLALIFLAILAGRSPRTKGPIYPEGATGPGNRLVFISPSNNEEVDHKSRILIASGVTEGILALELNGRVVAQTPVTGSANAKEILAKLETYSLGLVFNLREEIIPLQKTSLYPLYLSEVELDEGINKISALLIQLDSGGLPVIVEKKTIAVTKNPEASVRTKSLEVFNVTNSSGHVVAFLNVTMYNKTDFPVRDTFVLFNGSRNIRTNVAGAGGAEIDVAFSDNSGVSTTPGTLLRWILVVTSNFKPIPQARAQVFRAPVSFVDPPIPDEPPGETIKPYYWTDREESLSPHRFTDAPITGKFSAAPGLPPTAGTVLQVEFTGELCLVETTIATQATEGKILGCITFGYDIDQNATVTLKDLTNAGQGSQNFRDTVANDFPLYTLT